jgi:hypothetical protein
MPARRPQEEQIMRVSCLVGLLGIAAAACGGGKDSSLATMGDVTPFLGSWTTSNGTQIETCAGVSHMDSGPITLTIVAGATPGEITTQPQGGCALNWTVSGTVATLEGSQACATEAGSVGGTWTPTFETGTLTLSGAIITGADSGNALFVDGASQTCSFTQSASYSN